MRKKIKIRGLYNRNLLMLISISFLVSSLNSQISSSYQYQIDNYLNNSDNHLFSNKDSCYYYIDKAIDLAKINKDKDNLLYAIGYYIFANGHYFDLDNFDENLKIYSQVVKSLTPRDTMIRIQEPQLYLLNYQINYHYKKNDWVKVSKHFKLFDSIISTSKIEELSSLKLELYKSSLSFIANTNRKLGKLTYAKQFYIKQLDVLTSYKDSIVDWQRSYYNGKKLLSIIYRKQGKTNEAIQLLKESIEYYEKNYKGRYKNALITSYHELSKNYLLQECTELALKTLRKADNYLLPEDPFKRHQKMMFGDIYSKARKYSLATVTYDSVLQKTIHYRKGFKHQDIAEIYIKLGDLKWNQNQPNASLRYYQKALISASESFENDEIKENPLSKDVFSKTQLLTILKKKLEILNQELTKNYTQDFLDAATNTSKSIIITLDMLRPEFESKLDKEFLISQTYPVFHEMMQTAYIGYRATKNPKYLENAFLYMEKSKGILLLESVKNTQAIAFGDVPNHVLDEERLFRIHITNVEKKIPDADKETKKILNDSLFNLNTQYYDFLHTIEANYPKYYQLKYDTRTTTLDELQKFMVIDETVLTFHQAINSLYVLVINKSGVSFLKIPFSETIKNNIIQLYQQFSTPVLQEYEHVQKLSLKTYHDILSPCLKDSESKQLTIISDGLLNYIPFGALINEKKEYLINNYSIRYANSTTFLTNTINSGDQKESRLLAISPSFDSDSGFSALPFSKKETHLICQYFDGDELSNQNASLANFIKLKDKYTMLHFATHASVNDEEPDFSYLAFSSKENTENLLYVKDLYNYTINAKMVTLSGCETGIGKLRNGEGMLSLARGFQYAGVNSLTTTLWKNNDETTSELMAFYYEHLKNGYSKSKSLQKAKQDYLNTTEEEELKHPYYWAGFIVLGNNTPVANTTIWYWFLLILGLIIIGILAYPYRSIKLLK